MRNSKRLENRAAVFEATFDPRQTAAGRTNLLLFPLLLLFVSLPVLVRAAVAVLQPLFVFVFLLGVLLNLAGTQKARRSKVKRERSGGSGHGRGRERCPMKESANVFQLLRLSASRNQIIANVLVRVKRSPGGIGSAGFRGRSGCWRARGSYLLLCFSFSRSLSFLWSLCRCSLSLCLSLCLWVSVI